MGQAGAKIINLPPYNSSFAERKILSEEKIFIVLQNP
jgi:hypothetical protein